MYSDEKWNTVFFSFKHAAECVESCDLVRNYGDQTAQMSRDLPTCSYALSLVKVKLIIYKYTQASVFCRV